MSSRKGLPDFRKMRHDRHFVEELSNQSITAVGMMVQTERIETNREQPRSNLGDLAELTASIRARGVLEPLLVRPVPGSNTYQLIAGERRFHAAVEAGLDEVPCVEMDVSDQEALELALVENLQRRDLSAFEEADGYRTLVDKYHYTHDQVAAAIGKSRTTVTETLKLLAIPPAIQDLCRHADITAKSVLLLVARAGSIDEMERLVQEIAEGNLDRESARAAARSDAGAAGDPAETDRRDPDEGNERFRPLQIRLRIPGSSPVRLSLTIRQPGVSRDEVIATLESFLQQIRSGELDERLASPAPNGRTTNPK
ncbi:MAG: ParB/RepB/Spo0J family partition protein [Thermoanaerobaculaceae bacterium]|nr:ParB/RepB/Spo0J family partition protein [Thermoanaerobaculaceae bacterium]